MAYRLAKNLTKASSSSQIVKLNPSYQASITTTKDYVSTSRHPCGRRLNNFACEPSLEESLLVIPESQAMSSDARVALITGARYFWLKICHTQSNFFSFVDNKTLAQA